MPSRVERCRGLEIQIYDSSRFQLAAFPSPRRRSLRSLSSSEAELFAVAISREFEKLVAIGAFRQVETNPYIPRANGLIESVWSYYRTVHYVFMRPVFVDRGRRSACCGRRACCPGVLGSHLQGKHAFCILLPDCCSPLFGSYDVSAHLGEVP